MVDDKLDTLETIGRLARQTSVTAGELLDFVRQEYQRNYPLRKESLWHRGASESLFEVLRFAARPQKGE